jgi:hypothetical protein
MKEKEPIHLLVAKVSPSMLNQIILELNVSYLIMQFMMKLGEFCKRCRSMLIHHIFTLKLKPLVKYLVLTLTLYNHVVHDHTSSHYLSHLLGAPCSSRVPNDSPSRLKQTKSSLHILLSTLLCLGKLNPPLAYRIGDCLDKS